MKNKQKAALRLLAALLALTSASRMKPTEVFQLHAKQPAATVLYFH